MTEVMTLLRKCRRCQRKHKRISGHAQQQTQLWLLASFDTFVDAPQVAAAFVTAEGDTCQQQLSDVNGSKMLCSI